MSHSNRLWQFFENNPSQNAPWCEWQDAFKNWEYFGSFERKYLKLTKHRATAVNCRTDCGMGCPRNVVEHAEDDIVAVCSEQEEKPYALNKRDILVYTLNRSSLYKGICSCIGVTYKESKLDGVAGVFSLGNYIPSAGYYFSVYITFKDDQDELFEVVKSLCLLNQKEFALIIPTRKQLTPIIEDTLNRKQAISLVLSEEFSIQPNGSLKAIRSVTAFVLTREAFHDFTHPRENSGVGKNITQTSVAFKITCAEDKNLSHYNGFGGGYLKLDYAILKPQGG